MAKEEAKKPEEKTEKPKAPQTEVRLRVKRTGRIVEMPVDRLDALCQGRPPLTILDSGEYEVLDNGVEIVTRWNETAATKITIR